MNDTERETPVIFTWADRESSSWWLAAFIFLSFLLHSAAFFVFQGKDPLAPRTVRTAPTVQILTASNDPADRSPEGDALLQWIATHDPALVARVQTVEPKGLLDVPYYPSFLTLRTLPLAAPPEPPTIQIPPALDPLALIRSLSPSAKPAFPTPVAQATQIRLSTSFQSRAPDRLLIIPGAKTSTNVEPTTVLAGVNADGEPRFAFVQQASGDRTLDAEALAFVHALRFAPSGEALQWGTITIAWGDDATAPLKTPR
jgi:TonB family protein